ncbi:MAG TPA: protein kinase, partial [Planctomycetota bacterium]|nr:protein kinase [Planctomycetota bacterium]
MSTEEALDQFARAWLDGRAPDAGEFCAAHPECAVELRERIDGFLFVASGLFGSAEDPGAPGARLGDFQLLREIGRGGMGVVYEAEQVSLGRRVAVKVLAVHPAARPEQVERFRREAATAARLRHPGIVPIHSVGEENGARYFAMELVAGTPLDRLLERREAVGTQPGDVARSCRIAAEVADALEHA